MSLLARAIALIVLSQMSYWVKNIETYSTRNIKTPPNISSRTLTMTAKPMKTLKLHHPLIQLLITVSNNPLGAKLPRMRSIINSGTRE